MSQAIGVNDLRDSDLQPQTMYRILSDDEKKRLEAPLILGTTYTLNSSETKKVNIGLQPRADGSIHPVVKLQNNTMAGGIVFESESWHLLQTKLPDISKYFAGGQKIAWGSSWRTPLPVRIGDCEILFTSSYGAKSVVFDRPVEENTTVEDEESQQDPEPPTKKRKNYSPAVVMQKPSFDGLLNVLVCLDERFRRLQRNVTHVEKCVSVLCAELLLHIPAEEEPEKIDEVRVKELMKNNFNSLKEAVQLRLDPAFVELTFDIVFLELSVLCAAYITNQLRKALAAKKKRAL